MLLIFKLFDSGVGVTGVDSGVGVTGVDSDDSRKKKPCRSHSGYPKLTFFLEFCIHVFTRDSTWSTWLFNSLKRGGNSIFTKISEWTPWSCWHRGVDSSSQCETPTPRLLPKCTSFSASQTESRQNLGINLGKGWNLEKSARILYRDSKNPARCHA